MLSLKGDFWQVLCCLLGLNHNTFSYVIYVFFLGKKNSAITFSSGH